MKVTFLGTGAAEGVPSPFCRCTTCEHARTHRGRNIRRRASVLINDDLLIDPGPDTVSACADLSLDLTNLRYVLVTHGHFDHFYPHNLEIRSTRYLHAPPEHELTLLAGPTVLHVLNGIGYRDSELRMRRQPFLPFHQAELPPYTIRSVSATHAFNMGDAVNYSIDDGSTRLLYAVDTGIFEPQTWSALAGQRFTGIIVDSTNTTGSTSKGHLNLQGLQTMIVRFRDLELADDRTQLYATHFSHMANPPHEGLEQILQPLGVRCAFDGLVLDLH